MPLIDRFLPFSDLIDDIQAAHGPGDEGVALVRGDREIHTKGQITIPKRVRDALGLSVGDRIDFVDAERGVLMVPVKRDLKALRGMFKGRRNKPATLNQINDVIEELGSRK